MSIQNASDSAPAAADNYRVGGVPLNGRGPLSPDLKTHNYRVAAWADACDYKYRNVLRLLGWATDMRTGITPRISRAGLVRQLEAKRRHGLRLVAEATVKRHVAELEAAGMLLVDRGKKGFADKNRGMNAANAYRPAFGRIIVAGQVHPYDFTAITGVVDTGSPGAAGSLAEGDGECSDLKGTVTDPKDGPKDDPKDDPASNLSKRSKPSTEDQNNPLDENTDADQSGPNPADSGGEDDKRQNDENHKRGEGSHGEPHGDDPAARLVAGLIAEFNLSSGEQARVADQVAAGVHVREVVNTITARRRRPELMRRWRMGQSLGEAADALGVNLDQIKRDLFAVTGEEWLHVPDDQVAAKRKENCEVDERLQAGETPADIAAATGLTLGEVAVVLDAYGWRLNGARLTSLPEDALAGARYIAPADDPAK